MNDKAEDAAEDNIIGEETTIQLCASLLCCQARLVYLKTYLLLLKCSGHVVSWFSRRSAVPNEGTSHSGEAGVRVFEPGDSRVIQGGNVGHDSCYAMPNGQVKRLTTAATK